MVSCAALGGVAAFCASNALVAVTTLVKGKLPAPTVALSPSYVVLPVLFALVYLLEPTIELMWIRKDP